MLDLDPEPDSNPGPEPEWILVPVPLGHKVAFPDVQVPVPQHWLPVQFIIYFSVFSAFFETVLP
jgi:hypothetical protein